MLETIFLRHLKLILSAQVEVSLIQLAIQSDPSLFKNLLADWESHDKHADELHSMQLILFGIIPNKHKWFTES